MFSLLKSGTAPKGVRSKSYFFAALDESGFFFTDDGYTVTDEAIFVAASARVLDAGQCVVASTPYLESGTLYRLFRENHPNPECAIDGDVPAGRPTTALALWAPTATFNDEPKILRTVERGYASDPESAEQEFGARWVSKGTDRMFDPVALKTAAKQYPAKLPPVDAINKPRCYAAFDGGFTSDPSSAAIVREEEGILRTVELLEWRPQKGKPLKPSVVCAELIERLKAHGIRKLWTDIHYVESIREHAEAAGIALEVAPGGANGKEAVYTAARDAVLEERAEFSTEHTALAKQLREVLATPREGGGLKIRSPRRGKRHGDVCSAWTLAIYAAEQRPKGNSPLVHLPPHLRNEPGSRHGKKAPHGHGVKSPCIPPWERNGSGSRFGPGRGFG